MEKVSSNPRDYKPESHPKMTYVILLPKHEEKEENFQTNDNGILLPVKDNKSKQINERFGIVAVPSIDSYLKEGDIVAFSMNALVSDKVIYDKEYYMGFDVDFRKLKKINNN